MLKETSLARPYANAAFEYARAHHAEDSWRDMLSLLAAIVRDEQVNRLLSNPLWAIDQCATLCLTLAEGYLTETGQRFIRLLAKAKRLILLPEIHRLYELFYGGLHKTIEVEVQSVVPLSNEYQEKLKIRLRKRFNREPILQCTLNPSLIGGWVVRAQDTVIDGSIHGQLLKLKKTLIGETCN